MAKQIKGRKLFAATASAALVASAIVPVASAASVNDFNQVPSWAKDAVQYLVDNGSVQGDQNGNFKPFNNLSRAQAAEIITKELRLATGGSENYSDVSEGQWFYNAVVATSNAGIFEGNEKGQFLPNKELTRQEAAKVIVEAFGLTGTTNLGGYPDANKVPGWAKAYFETAVANGVINGKGALLAPTDKITNAEFATMIKRAVDATTNAAVESISAINSTTVEVDFKENIEDINSLKFTIDGLEVKNAVVKQTDASVAVITTSTQEGGKEYTVSLNGEKLGTFKGVSAVVPTSIKLQQNTLQSKVGNEVTLKADIGVKAAGVPVTFNVDAPTGSLNKDQIVEVYTNAEGIAEFSYTQYAADMDTVFVYPTGAPTVRETAHVYWGVSEILTIEDADDKKSNSLTNGEKKVYKVTFKHPKTGAAMKNEKIHVTFAEHINVTSDKLQDVTVTDPKTGLSTKPYQLSNGNKAVFTVETDDKGVATFNVTGTNAAVTPIVFVDGTNFEYFYQGTIDPKLRQDLNGKLDSTELQAQAPKLSFVGAQLDSNLEITAVGNQEAATGITNGREYKIKVTGKDGKAYANGVINVALNEKIDREIATKTEANIRVKTSEEVSSNPHKYGEIISSRGESQQLKLDKNGEATIVVYSAVDKDYATPIIWIDQNLASNYQEGVLESGEPKQLAEITYFATPKVQSSELKVYKVGGDGKEYKKTFVRNEVAQFTYQPLNQSGKAINEDLEATFEVINNSGSQVFVNYAGNNITIEAYGKATVKFSTTTSAASITVRTNGASDADVTVNASAYVKDTNKYLGSQTASAKFSKYALEAVNGFATIDATDDVREITVTNRDGNHVFKYEGATLKDGRVNSNAGLSREDFEELFVDFNNVKLSVQVDSEGKVTIVVTETSNNPEQAETTSFTVAGTQVTLAELGTEEVLAKYTSNKIGTVVADFSFDLTVNNGDPTDPTDNVINGETIQVSAGDTAADIVEIINQVIETATIEADIEAAVENDKVIIRALNDNIATITIANADGTTLFNDAVRTTVAEVPAVAGVYDYDFDAAAEVSPDALNPNTFGDLKEGDKVVIGNVTYTASTTNSVGNLTFNATSGTLANDLTQLALVITTANAKWTATSSTNVLTLTETTGNEATSGLVDENGILDITVIR